ncbi:MAG: outer membrane beta-barrel protein [Nostocaceae cyanobacterium]|nr:outer membrane beta-barrel protein [Nostocaceae cyanobacterium]
MKSYLKSFVAISALSSLVAAPVILSAGEASAETVIKNGTDASYIGAGISAGVTNGGQAGTTKNFGGNLTGRFAIPNAPVSIRGDVMWSDDTSAIIPQASLDVPIAKRTNVYFTAGYSFVEKDGQPTPIGNKDGVVLGVGAESEVAKDIIIYGNTKVGLDNFTGTSAKPVSIQVGAGYSFK